MTLRQSDSDTLIWLICLLITSVAVGVVFNGHYRGTGAGLAFFFGVMTWLFIRRQ